MKKSVLFLLVFLLTTSVFAQKLYKAVEAGDTEKVKTLLKKGADVNEYAADGLFPLWRAAADNNYDIAALLLQNGAKVNQLDKVEPLLSTSLEICCQEGYLKMIMLLVDYGADVNRKGFHDFTPIRIAARNGHIDTVKYLADKGAVVDQKATDGATALEHSSFKGHLEVVKFLIAKGANVNNKDKEGDFPLGEAARGNHTQIMQALIDHGADMTLKNNKNESALDLARASKQTQAVELLLKYSK
jgi:ankyrin repeat protein